MIQTIDDIVTPICASLAAIFSAFSIKYLVEVAKLHVEYRRNSFHILMGRWEWFRCYRTKKMIAKLFGFLILTFAVCAYWWRF